MNPEASAKCELCGELMPTGEEMFKFHGYSGSCPKPPLQRSETVIADRESLRRYAVEEDTSLLTGFVSARLETTQDKHALTALIGVLQKKDDATVSAFLDLWLAGYQAIN